MDFRTLKSGSDVRGIAVGEEAVLTQEVARTLGRAFVRFLAQRIGKPADQIMVALGRDSRVSGPSLLMAAAEGIAAEGATANDYGMCTTPSMYMAILTDGFRPNGSIMITASHHPWKLNGLKFFTEAGGLGFHELDELLQLAQTLPETGNITRGQVSAVPFLPRYVDHLRQLIINGVNPEVTQPLLGLHVVVDAGNGAGGFYADMLQGLGAWIEGSQFLEPDGHFPNHIPNPENPEAMDSLAGAVLRVGADIGVIFDADCDRAAIVDHTGKEINRNRLIAMISAILLENDPGATIVTDSVTSSGLAEFIQEWGGVHYRYKRGYRNVIDEAIRLNAAGIDCPLAIETSGHAAMRENYFLDDGAYLVTKIIIKTAVLRREGKDLEELLAALPEPAEAVELRLPIRAEDFRTAGETVLEGLRTCAGHQPHWHIDKEGCEGVRLSFDDPSCDGWALLRLSVHDPILPLNIESNRVGGVRLIASQLYVNLRAREEIDPAPLELFISSD